MTKTIQIIKSVLECSNGGVILFLFWVYYSYKPNNYIIVYSSDDRSVRDRERQGALIHFSSSQATEMTVHPRHDEPQTRQPNPRAEHVKTMGSARGMFYINLKKKMHSAGFLALMWTCFKEYYKLSNAQNLLKTLVSVQTFYTHNLRWWLCIQIFPNVYQNNCYIPNYRSLGRMTKLELNGPAYDYVLLLWHNQPCTNILLLWGTWFLKIY